MGIGIQTFTRRYDSTARNAAECTLSAHTEHRARTVVESEKMGAQRVVAHQRRVEAELQHLHEARAACADGLVRGFRRRAAHETDSHRAYRAFRLPLGEICEKLLRPPEAPGTKRRQLVGRR